MDKKFKIFVIVAIVFLGIAIVGSAFIVLKMVGNNNNDSNSNKQVVAEKEKKEPKLVPIDLGDAITTNIFDEAGAQHIAKIVISFGVDESSKEYKKFNEEFKSKNVIIRDEIIHILREQTYEMMAKADAQTKLGDEITVRINKLLKTEIIGKVYFGDFFVQ